MPKPARSAPVQAPVRWLIAVLCIAACSVALAVEPAGAEAARVAAERAEIQAERNRLEAQFDAEKADCAGRFAVTACLDDVRERRRAALEGPRMRALALDDAERLRRAAARRDALARKQRDTMRRPRVVVPLSARTSGVQIEPPRPALRGGAMVRLLDPAHLGQVGQVRAVSAVPRRLASRVRAPGVEVLLEDNTTLLVPRTDVEVLA